MSTYIKVNGHSFNDCGLCNNCGEDFIDVDGEACEAES